MGLIAAGISVWYQPSSLATECTLAGKMKDIKNVKARLVDGFVQDPSCYIAVCKPGDIPHVS
jgi:hypothetical protein